MIKSRGAIVSIIGRGRDSADDMAVALFLYFAATALFRPAEQYRGECAIRPTDKQARS